MAAASAIAKKNSTRSTLVSVVVLVVFVLNSFLNETRLKSFSPFVFHFTCGSSSYICICQKPRRAHREGFTFPQPRKPLVQLVRSAPACLLVLWLFLFSNNPTTNPRSIPCNELLAACCILSAAKTPQLQVNDSFPSVRLKAEAISQITFILSDKRQSH